MAFLNKQILIDLGINLSEQDYTLLDEQFEATLEQRVIDEIVDELDEDQAERLSEIQRGDDKQLVAWLKQNVPQLNEIISDEVDILLGEIASDSDKFNKAQ